ncbi:Imm65 family immunity protein [Bacteroides finegoldii]
MLIDKGYLPAPYIKIYESFPNDSNTFYYISNSDSPFKPSQTDNLIKE